MFFLCRLASNLLPCSSYEVRNAWMGRRPMAIGLPKLPKLSFGDVWRCLARSSLPTYETARPKSKSSRGWTRPEEMAEDSLSALGHLWSLRNVRKMCQKPEETKMPAVPTTLSSDHLCQELSKIRLKFANPKSLSGYDKKKCPWTKMLWTSCGRGACLDAAACCKVWHVSMHPNRYVWKLLYAYMLGYDIDFGHFQAELYALGYTSGLWVNVCQAVELCSASKFSEKTAGSRPWTIFCWPGWRGWDFRLDTNCRYLATSLLLADNNDMVRMIVNSVKTDMASGNEAKETKLSKICWRKILKEVRQESRVALVWTTEHCFKCRSTTVLEEI